MSKNISELPFTELNERVALMSRATNSTDKSRVRGATNDEYVRQLPKWEDWQFLIAQSSLSTFVPYRTGSVSVNTLSTAITFSSDVALDSTYTGWQIKFSNNSNVYEFTYTNATGGTISPPLSGDQNITAGSYVLFQSKYSLASDFSRFPKNGGIILYQGGRPSLIQESQSREDWYAWYSPSPSTPVRCQLINWGTAGTQAVEITPPTSKATVLPYDYVLKLNPMREVTGGFIDISAGGTSVTGSAGTTLFTQAQTGWYLRVDAFGKGQDSEWYRILAIQHNSSLTLQTAFGLSGATTAAFTICPAPAVPSILHDAIMYGAAMSIFVDQNDPQFMFMASQKAASIVHARTLFKSRVYNQEIDTIATEWRYRR